jgi:hypothetical protein
MRRKISDFIPCLLQKRTGPSFAPSRLRSEKVTIGKIGEDECESHGEENQEMAANRRLKAESDAQVDGFMA